MARIDVLCTDGSPLGVSVSSIYGNDHRVGVGGAELALLTMCEAWHNAGHKVTLFNNPKDPGGSPFDQRGVKDFHPNSDRDILIVFRSPNPKVAGAKGLKVWWSCDQQTKGDFRIFAADVDRIVCISDFHADYFKSRYGIGTSIVIDLPVRVQDYQNPAEKIRGRVLFSSVPSRGLEQMKSAWDIIWNCFPEAELVVTSDYRLWGSRDAGNDRFRLLMARAKKVHFLGAVKRNHFNVIQHESQVLAYPCTYDELFCISVAEAMVAGVYPVTSTTGALATTNMGIKIGGNPEDEHWIRMFAMKVVSLLDDPLLEQKQKDIQQDALDRFHPDKILEQWDKKVFNV